MRAGRWRPVAQRAMRASMAVILFPTADQHLGFLRRVQELPFRQHVPQRAVEALDVSILPWAPWLNERCPYPQLAQLLLHLLGREFWPVVRTNMLRDAPGAEQLRQTLLYVFGGQPPSRPDAQTLPGLPRPAPWAGSSITVSIRNDRLL